MTLETRRYEAEVAQLLDLVANSLYSDPEIFVRELVSNASDAADKLRYEGLTDDGLYEGDSELKVWVSFDKDAKTVSIRDNGIGMTRDDVIEHLGTIAKSGTKAFREMVEQQKKNDHMLIGQFGVGFYSSFVVADKVTVRTRKAGMKTSEGVEWVSDGKGEYTVANIELAARGTEITLHLKEQHEEFLDGMRLRHIIKKYSDHIMLPIEMLQEKLPDPDNKDEDADADKAPEWEVVNSANALWTLPKSKIKKEQYNELYKHISHDFEDALTWVHSKVEGKSEYTMLLYIPKRAPFDLWNREHQHGLKLYVRRVFIMDDAEHFLPMYLRFVKGIIDSNDLPLNISREILQSSRDIDRMKSGCVKKILGLLQDMADKKPEEYQAFWKEFGQCLKEGPVEDFSNKDAVAKLLRFASTHTGNAEQTVSLDDYIARMKDKQEKIYYVIADSHSAASNSPLLEVFRKQGIEVLLLSDRVDEWLMSHMTEYEGKTLKSIAKGELSEIEEEQTEEQKKQKEEQEKNFDGVIKQMKEALGEKVGDVRLTQRLVDSPACVVYGENDMSGHLQRIMQAAGQAIPGSKPILELNAEHRLVQKLSNESDDERFANLSQVLLGQALLAEGENLENPAEFVKLLNALL